MVDCENSDPYKLHAFINSLDKSSLSVISKIIFYDDSHTTIGWEILKDRISIPVEYHHVERVSENKSLVDIEMAVGITSLFISDQIDSFILCSSDSDFWGVMKSLPTARYLVLYEYLKCGTSIKAVWADHNIANFSLDDFYSEQDDTLRHEVLMENLQRNLVNLVGMEPYAFAKMVYKDSFLQASREEMQQFCDSYVMRLSLKLDKNGVFIIGL